MLARAFLTLTAAALGALGACGAHVEHAVPIAVLVDGDRGAVGAVPATVAGLALHELVVPPPPRAADTTAATSAVTRARAAYVRGDFEACRAELQHVDLTATLAAGQREVAARALAFDAGCAWGALAKADAGVDAARLASYGLELPVAAVAPDVEALIGDALIAAGRTAPTRLAVTGQVGARLHVDGRADGCALPCIRELAPGDHVLAVDADGFAPAVQHVRLPDVTHVAIAQTPASAALAAQQWRARQGRGLPSDDATGATLMARFGGASRIAWLHGDTRLVGGLVVNGVIVARSEAARGDAAGLVRELAYDGNVIPRPRVWQRPWFWIAVSVAAIAVAGGIVALTYTPPTNTAGGF